VLILPVARALSVQNNSRHHIDSFERMFTPCTLAPSPPNPPSQLDLAQAHLEDETAVAALAAVTAQPAGHSCNPKATQAYGSVVVGLCGLNYVAISSLCTSYPRLRSGVGQKEGVHRKHGRLHRRTRTRALDMLKRL